VLHRPGGPAPRPAHHRLRVVVLVVLVAHRRRTVPAPGAPVVLVGGVVTVFGTVVVQLVVGRHHSEGRLQLAQRAHATPRRPACRPGPQPITPATTVTLTRGDQATRFRHALGWIRMPLPLPGRHSSPRTVPPARDGPCAGVRGFSAARRTPCPAPSPAGRPPSGHASVGHSSVRPRQPAGRSRPAGSRPVPGRRRCSPATA